MDEAKTTDRAALVYLIPMGGFLALTSLEGSLPRTGGTASNWYPWAYAAKVVVVAGLLWACRETWRDLGRWPGMRVMAVAAVLGLAVAAAWVGLDGHYPEIPFLGKRTAFDPYVLKPWVRRGFIAVRLLGLVGLVPLMEELFWRSFLVRWLIDADFKKVPIGRMTPLAAALSSACFGLAHPEWLPGILTGLAWAGLVWWSRSLMACVASHAVANLALGTYVILTGHWIFW